MRRKIKVYIAGPYSSNLEESTNIAMDVWERLYNMDFIPFCPHLAYYIDKKHPHPYGEWLKYDIEWLKACDCVYRFEGESKGADEEVMIAHKLGMPVFRNFRNIYDYYSEPESYIENL